MYIEETKYPMIPDGLISYLEVSFPDKLPIKEITPFELGLSVGIQTVIRHLKSVKQWSENSEDV